MDSRESRTIESAASSDQFHHCALKKTFTNLPSQILEVFTKIIFSVRVPVLSWEFGNQRGITKISGNIKLVPAKTEWKRASIAIVPPVKYFVPE